MKMNSKEYSKTCSRRMKQKWQDSAYRKAQLVAQGQGKATVEARLARSEAHKAMWADPKYRKKMVAAAKRGGHITAAKLVWADPEWRKKRLKVSADPKVRAKMSKSQHRAWVDGTRDREAIIAKIKRSHNTPAKRKEASENFYSNGRMANSKMFVYTCNRRKIYMRSSWEIALAKWYDKRRIKWMYEPKRFRVGDSNRLGNVYIPDFYLPKENCYVEVKGFLTSRNRSKLRRFHKRFPEIKLVILYAGDLRKMGILNSRNRPICNNNEVQ